MREQESTIVRGLWKPRILPQGSREVSSRLTNLYSGCRGQGQRTCEDSRENISKAGSRGTAWPVAKDLPALAFSAPQFLADYGFPGEFDGRFCGFLCAPDIITWYAQSREDFDRARERFIKSVAGARERYASDNWTPIWHALNSSTEIRYALCSSALVSPHLPKVVGRTDHRRRRCKAHGR